MAQFQYTARIVQSGDVLSSTCCADNEDIVRSELQRMGYKVDSVKPHKKNRIFGCRRRITLRDLVNMCRRLSVMYAAGLPLLDCLSSLNRENESKILSDTMENICNDIEQGSNVADAFSKYKKVFSPLFINLLKAGEAAGKFDYMLDQLAMYLEKEHDLKRKIRQAFTYPLVVVVTIFIVVTAMMIIVVPAFSDLYMKLGITLPGPTIALISLSNNATYILPLVIISIFGLWMLHRKFRTIAGVKRRMDRWKMSMPMLGSVYHKIVLLKYIRTLCTMINAGVQLSDAIDISADVADNAVASEASSMIQRNIKQGGTITEVIKLHSFFPQTIIHAFSTGEEAGELDKVLSKFTKGVEQDVDDGIRSLVTKIEPLMIAVLSVIIGYILLAIYLPIFDLMKILHK